MDRLTRTLLMCSGSSPSIVGPVATYTIAGAGNTADIEVLTGDVVIAIGGDQTASTGNGTLTNLGTANIVATATPVSFYGYYFTATSNTTITTTLGGTANSHAIITVFRGLTETGMGIGGNTENSVLGPVEFSGSVSPGAGGYVIELVVLDNEGDFAGPSAGYTLLGSIFPNNGTNADLLMAYKVMADGSAETPGNIAISPNEGWRARFIGLPLA